MKKIVAILKSIDELMKKVFESDEPTEYADYLGEAI